MPVELKEELVLLCEGPADQNCFRKLLEKRQDIPRFSMLDPKQHWGVSGFERSLTAIKGDRHAFLRLKGVLIVADSGDSPDDAFNQIKKQIISAQGYPVPSKPMEVAARINDHPAIAVMLLPDENTPGGLETLCVREMLERNPWAAECVETFLECGESTAHELPPEKKDKARYHCMVALTYPEDPSRAVSMAFKEPPNPLISVESQCFADVERRLRKFCNEVLGSPS
jgi:hypothetical protein